MNDQKETIKFQGLTKVYMCEVLEGEGTKESIYRIVRYFYNEKFEPLGKIDLAFPQKI
jgi:hypothetical protein